MHRAMYRAGSVGLHPVKPPASRRAVLSPTHRAIFEFALIDLVIDSDEMDGKSSVVVTMMMVI